MSPSAAVEIRDILKEALPDCTDEIIESLREIKEEALRRNMEKSQIAKMLKELCKKSFDEGRPAEIRDT